MINDNLIYKDDKGVDSFKVSIANWPHGNETPAQNDARHKEAAKQHIMLSEQHEALMQQNALIIKSHKAIIYSAIFSGIIALATCTLVYFAYQDIQNIQESMQQQQTSKLQKQAKP